MARRRTTFGKLQRDREKQAKAQAKLRRRAEQASEEPGDDDVVAPAEEIDQATVLARLAELHAAFDDGQIGLDDFETRRDELRNSLRID